MGAKSETEYAFPVFRGGYIYHNGMTLRDWFAGQAMNGLYAGRPPMGGMNINHFKSEAEISYLMADAMLEAREK